MNNGDVRHLVAELGPFSKRAELHIEDASATESRVRLPLVPGNLGQGDAIHPSAIFTLAEATATALGAFAFDPDKISLLTKAVEIRYRKPGKTDLWGRARLPDEVNEALLSRASTEGKLDVPVRVEVVDEAGERVAEATVTLSLRKL